MQANDGDTGDDIITYDIITNTTMFDIDGNGVITSNEAFPEPALVRHS